MTDCLRFACPRLTGRSAVLDELKGLAILLVIAYHASGTLVWQNFLHGDLGVDIFVILSGVGLALSSRDETPGTFLVRRLWRIMPAYWVALTIYCAANMHFLQHNYGALNIALHYVGLHAWFGDSYAMSINDSFWFMTLILSLYLVYAFGGLATLALDRLIGFAALGSAAVAALFFFWNQPACYGHLALRLPGFFLGVIAGRAMRHGQIEIPLTMIGVLGLAVGVYAPYMFGVIYYSAFVAGLLMLGYAFVWKKLAPASLESSTARLLRFLGDHSLEIFLLHQPLIRDYNYYLQGRWFQRAQPTTFQLIVGIVIGLAVTLFASVELRRLLQRLPRPAFLN